MSAAGLHEGDVVTYVPENRWCYDGWAIAEERPNGSVVLVDTYWISGGKVVAPAEFEVQFNLADFDRVPYPQVWEQFAEADRQAIPRHSGYQTELYVRKGAEPDLTTQIRNAREAVSDAESRVRSAQWSLDVARRELARLEGEDPDACSAG